MSAVQTTYTTQLPARIEGALADNGPHDAVPLFNAEASALIRPGVAVKFGATDFAALLPTAQGEKIVGIVLRSDAYSVGAGGDLDQTAGTVQQPLGGLNIGVMMAVLRKGRIYAMNRGSAVVPGDRLHVRAVSNATGYQQVGGLENAADSTNTIDCTSQAIWRTSTAQGAIGILEVDFVNKP